MTRNRQDRPSPVVATDQDIELECKDCHSPFIFTIGEQKFFESKGFTPPTRCAECRAKNKERKGRARD